MFGKKKKKAEQPIPTRYALYIKCLGRTQEYVVGVDEDLQKVIAMKEKLDKGFSVNKVVAIDEETFVLDKIVHYRVDRWYRPANLGWG